MIEHVVLFKWNEGAPEESIDAALKGLSALKEQIPGILDLTCGRNFSDRSKGFHAALVVRFADPAALDAYIPHPAHQAVIRNLIQPIRADVLVVDYETGD